MSQTATAPINPITNQPYSAYYKPGQDSGAITLEWRKNILVATVRSFTNPKGPRYTIEVNAQTGHVRCSCEACRLAIKRHGYPKLTQTVGYCKHIHTFWATLAQEVVEHNAEAEKAPAQAPEADLVAMAAQAKTKDQLCELRFAVIKVAKAHGLSLNWFEPGNASKAYRMLVNEIGQHVGHAGYGRPPLAPLAEAFIQAIGEVR